MRLLAKSGIIDPTYSVANTATETALGAVFIVQNSYTVQTVNNYPGRSYNYRARGYVNSDATTPGTLTLRLRYGSTNPATSSGTQLVSSGAMTLPASLVNAILDIDCDVDFESISSTASASKVSVNGRVMLQGLSNAPLVFPFMGAFGTPPANQITVDTTTFYYMQLTAQFSSALATNTITVAKSRIVGLTSNI
jgi:hypothetical protein